MKLTIHNSEVVVDWPHFWPDSDVNCAVTSRIFLEWLSNLDAGFRITRILLQAVDFRGEHTATNVLFVRMSVSVDGVPHSQIVELRGGTCVMLPVLTCDDEHYTVLTRQPRLATGDPEFEELPAGMIDGGTFAGAAARELQEELGLTFLPEELINLTPEGGIYLSPGLLDEQARFFLAERTVSADELEAMRGKATGCAAEGERITLRVIPLSDLLLQTRDGKTLIAWALYQEYEKYRNGSQR